jgi:pimeloyl-ACP methyl ester carboxylesterase
MRLVRLVNSTSGAIVRMRHLQVTILLAFNIVFCIALAIGLSSEARSSTYARQIDKADGVIVFVHGVLGDGKSTWINDTSKKYWPAMFADDPALSGTNVFVYEYPTSLWASMSIDELADDMKLQLTSRKVTQHRTISFIAHSMGGLVTRAFLLKNRDVASKTSFLYLLATPTTGSDIANIASFITSSPQLTKMKPMNAEDYLADTMRQWVSAGFAIPTYCAYEKKLTYGREIVAFKSAAALCNKSLQAIDANHIEIAKPASEESAVYRLAQIAFENEQHKIKQRTLKKLNPSSDVNPEAARLKDRPSPDPQTGTGNIIQNCKGDGCIQSSGSGATIIINK